MLTPWRIRCRQAMLLTPFVEFIGVGMADMQVQLRLCNKVPINCLLGTATGLHPGQLVGSYKWDRPFVGQPVVWAGDARW
jgi:hypothetical protein